MIDYRLEKKLEIIIMNKDIMYTQEGVPYTDTYTNSANSATVYPTYVENNVSHMNDDNFTKHETQDQVAFVRKVLGIVSCQMAVTFAVSLLSSYSLIFGLIMKSQTCMIASIVTLIVVIIPLKFCGKIVPVNYFLLFVFTICESFMIGSLTADLTVESVFLSEAVTVATLTGLFGGALACSSNAKLMICLIFGLVATLFAQMITLITLACLGYISQAAFVVYALLGALGAGIYVMIDLVLIMIPGATDLDDYILYSLMLYVDIIRMFIYILMIFGSKK